MFKRIFFFFPSLFFPFTQGISLPTQTVALEQSEEKTEEELEVSQDSLFNEEEEISALPKKGGRPQVIQIPSKPSLPH